MEGPKTTCTSKKTTSRSLSLINSKSLTEIRTKKEASISTKGTNNVVTKDKMQALTTDTKITIIPSANKTKETQCSTKENSKTRIRLLMLN
jgi:hypothetical protein